jgi:hypothetical protein
MFIAIMSKNDENQWFYDGTQRKLLLTKLSGPQITIPTMCWQNQSNPAGPIRGHSEAIDSLITKTTNRYFRNTLAVIITECSITF